MVRTEELRRLSEALLKVLAVAAAYYATGRLGLWQRIVLEGAVVTPLWLPTGVAVTCLLWMGLRIWPGIALGALLLIESIGPFSLSDLGIVAANTLAPVCAYLLLRKVRFGIAMDRLRDGVALVFLGGLLPILLSATVGTGVLALSGKLAWSAFWPVWAAWWTGDAMGVLVGTPLLIALSRARLPWNTHRWPEVTALVVTAAVITPLATRSALALLFLVFPLLTWAALRFQLAGRRRACCSCPYWGSRRPPTTSARSLITPSSRSWSTSRHSTARPRSPGSCSRRSSPNRRASAGRSSRRSAT